MNFYNYSCCSTNLNAKELFDFCANFDSKINCYVAIEIKLYYLRYKDLLFWDPINATKAKEILLAKLQTEHIEDLVPTQTSVKPSLPTEAGSCDFFMTMKRIKLERQAEVRMINVYLIWRYMSFLGVSY